eukprot:CAMPEP_0204300022 /NCGR_PEP_ID=MMETSP0468-20130131/77843_1 /ASSEMBLY_ACC=CAM_ASM_000383 /TAXON_ID=2969 /ORGANISM="Oxyrrhis marina" /LENGTH=69 /DNA_ID=CAMNT_0051279047 /DNA_START=56 /DNA_END=265 /DNA_ORIENTATION=-
MKSFRKFMPFSKAMIAGTPPDAVEGNQKIVKTDPNAVIPTARQTATLHAAHGSPFSNCPSTTDNRNDDR